MISGNISPYYSDGFSKYQKEMGMSKEEIDTARQQQSKS